MKLKLIIIPLVTLIALGLAVAVVGAMSVDLTITKTHAGNFTQGETGATYTVTVTNSGGDPTDGTTVTVTDPMPAGLTATAASGTGWNCTGTTFPTTGTVTCTRSDVLASGADYSTLTITVDVSPTASGTITNTASVVGGGDATSANGQDMSIVDTAAVVEGGHTVKTDVKRINFTKSEWKRSKKIEGGCLFYTATSDFTDVEIIQDDGTKQTHTFDKDDEVIVCGKTVHLPEED